MPALAPLPLPATPLAPPPPPSNVENLIGQLTATAAAAVAVALEEYRLTGVRDGKEGGAWIAQLYELRQATLGEIDDFMMVARTRGRQVLRDTYSSNVSDATIDLLVDTVLQVLGRVIKWQSH
jgi:hypothetical protein